MGLFTPKGTSPAHTFPASANTAAPIADHEPNRRIEI